MTTRIGIGLVGAGRMGSIHAHVIATAVPEARLAGIADVRLGAARRLASQVGEPPVFGSVDELLAAPGVQAAIVAVSSGRHLDVIRAAAAAGKDVLCEKPIALTMTDTTTALELSETAGIRLQVGLMRRWDRDYGQAKARLASGALGRPMLFKSLQFDPEPPPVEFADPKVSGGIMIDMGIHEFDLARWLMADEVAQVQAYGSVVAAPALSEVGDVDSAVISLRFAGGTIGTVELARTNTYGEDVRTEVLATAGSVWVGRLPVSHGRWSSRAVADGALLTDGPDASIPRFEAAYIAQTRGFVRALLDDRPVAVSGSDGRSAMAIALAADRAMRTGQPVDVEPPPDRP
jgi:predicted dehydrogenase